MDDEISPRSAEETEAAEAAGGGPRRNARQTFTDGPVGSVGRPPTVAGCATAGVPSEGGS